MEQSRQMYVKRELRRRRIENYYRAVAKVKNFLAGAALIVAAEVFILACIPM